MGLPQEVTQFLVPNTAMEETDANKSILIIGQTDARYEWGNNYVIKSCTLESTDNTPH